MSNAWSLTMARELQISIGFRRLMSTCIESINLSLNLHTNYYDFFVCLQSMTVNDIIPPAITAASRPRTPRQQACPATFVSTFKQALIPIRLKRDICSCQTPNLSLARHFCCYSAGCSVLYAEIPLMLGSSEQLPRSLLSAVCMHVGYWVCWLYGDGHGNGESFEKLSKAVWTAIPSSRNLTLKLFIR